MAINPIFDNSNVIPMLPHYAVGCFDRDENMVQDEFVDAALRSGNLSSLIALVGRGIKVCNHFSKEGNLLVCDNFPNGRLDYPACHARTIKRCNNS